MALDTHIFDNHCILMKLPYKWERVLWQLILFTLASNVVDSRAVVGASCFLTSKDLASTKKIFYMNCLLIDNQSKIQWF